MRILAVVLLSSAVVTAAPARTSLRGGPFEASGVTAVPGGVLIVDDARPGDVLWLSLAAERTSDVLVVPTGIAVADPEGITTDGTWVYVVGSQSRGKGASLARFKFDAVTKTVSSVESLSGLEGMLSAVVPAAADEADGKKNKKRQQAAALNIEGLAWDPKGSRLLLGVRSPVVGGMALAVPLRLRDAARPLSADNVTVEEALPLDLGGSGIRGIEYDATAGVFQVIAGHPTGARDFRLVTWPGTGTTVQDVQAFSAGEKPEGVTRATLAGRNVTIVVFDTGQYAVLR